MTVGQFLAAVVAFLLVVGGAVFFWAWWQERGNDGPRNGEGT